MPAGAFAAHVGLHQRPLSLLRLGCGSFPAVCVMIAAGQKPQQAAQQSATSPRVVPVAHHVKGFAGLEWIMARTLQCMAATFRPPPQGAQLDEQQQIRSR